MAHGCPGQAQVPLYPAPLDGGMQVNPGAIFQPLFADTCDTADALFRDAVCNLIDLQVGIDFAWVFLRNFRKFENASVPRVITLSKPKHFLSDTC